MVVCVHVHVHVLMVYYMYMYTMYVVCALRSEARPEESAVHVFQEE